MSTAITKPNGNAALMEMVLMAGDLSKLTADQRVAYYNAVCDSVGLNPLTKPFEYIVLNDKLTLYARRDATDQLRKIHKITVNIISREVVEQVYVVTAKASDQYGREDEAIGAVPLVKEDGEWKTSQSGKRYFAGNGTFKPLSPDDRANAMMKAETKAKRRVTLSICGLGFLDETELETIPPHAKAEAHLSDAPNDSPQPTPQSNGNTKSQKPAATSAAKPDNTQPPSEAEIWSRTMGNLLKARGVKSVKASVKEICNVYGVGRLSEAYQHRDEIRAAIEAGEFDAPQQTTQAS